MNGFLSLFEPKSSPKIRQLLEMHCTAKNVCLTELNAKQYYYCLKCVAYMFTWASVGGVTWYLHV